MFKPWKRFLSRRARLAVILVAITATLAYWGLVSEIEQEHDDFRIVSLVKQQIAETVTTFYLAHLSAYAPDSSQRKSFLRQLDQAIFRVDEGHHVLSLKKASLDIPDEMEAVLREVYIGKQKIDDQMEAFLREARDVVESGGDLSELNDLARSHTTLLPNLGRLHERLRDKAEAAFNHIRLFATLQWIVVLGALGLVVVLIVGPATRRTEQVMTEMWRAKAKASERAVAADAARAAQANFVRTINHELRTPLNAILGMAQLLRMQDLSPRQDEYVGDIQNAGEHLLGLINDILDLARIEANKVIIRKGPVALNEILETATGMLRPLASQKSLDLGYRCARELSEPYVADSAHIHQVLVNLIGNAIKFTEKGWIKVRAVPAGPEEAGITPVRFEVEDTGIGVPRDRRDAIFEEFQQADLIQDYSGTGLGLAISRALVRLMGGQMGLDSERTKGSLFWFVLPLERAARPQVDEARGPGRLNESPATSE